MGNMPNPITILVTLTTPSGEVLFCWLQTKFMFYIFDISRYDPKQYICTTFANSFSETFLSLKNLVISAEANFRSNMIFYCQIMYY